MAGPAKMEFVAGSAAKQSQLLLHGISPQPAHLYQLASPIPFSAGAFPGAAINLQKVNQPGLPLTGALAKGVPTTM